MTLTGLGIYLAVAYAAVSVGEILANATVRRIRR